MTDLRTLIFGKGSEAALAVEKAKAGVDEARAGIEEAKQRLEDAKSHLLDANAAFDAVLAEMEEAGLSKSKAKKAIEEINQTLVSIGALSEADAPAITISAEKPARRKRKDKAEEAGEGENPPAGVGQDPVPVATEELVVLETVETTSVISATEEAAVVQVITETVDTSSELSEIIDLINESTADIDGKEVVQGILNKAVELAASVARQESAHLDLDFFRTFLIELANDPEESSFLLSVYSAFVDVITAVENQASDIKLILPSEEVQVEEAVISVVEDAVSGDTSQEPEITAETPLETVVAPVVVEEADIVEPEGDELDQYAGGDEDVEDYEDYVEDVGVSDDATFPISDEEHEADVDVTVVENIDDMNFLADASDNEADTTASVTTEKTEEQSKEEEAPKRKLAPPSFLRK